MKIIGVDNHGNENVADILVASGVAKGHGTVMVEALNEAFCPTDHCSTFYQLVEDDHVLNVGFEP